MKNRKIIFPAISVGLLTTTRHASADIVDFGPVAEALSVQSTIGGIAGNTIGGFTINGLTFVGSHLSDLINGQTVNSILEADLGPQNPGSGSFSLSGPQGASGGFTFAGNFTVTSGDVSLTGLPVMATLTSCTPNDPAASPGCSPTNNLTISINPYDPAGMISNMGAAQIFAVPPNITNGATVTHSNTVTIDFGSFGGNTYQGEEIESFTNVSASQVPEPSSWSLAALAMAMLAWYRRLRSKQS